MPATQTWVYPTNMELMEVDQNLLPVLELSDPIFELFPVRNHDSARVVWEQEDDYTGLMQMRGYEGEFPSVNGTAIKRYSADPGIYGEHDVVSEQEITERRGYGMVNQPIDVSDLVLKRHAKLATRHYNRMSWILWQLLTTGVYNIVGPTGAVVKRDAYSPQSYTGSIWATPATATPLGDFRGVTLLHRGHSVSFGSNATAFMNLKTFNNMIANTNANDLGGRRTTGLATIEGLDDFNKLALKDNLPNVRVYDEGYKSDGNDGLTAGAFYTFIPDGVVVIVGRRTNGAPIGEFQLTRNASNPDCGAAPLVRVIDKGADENSEPPRKVKVFRGFNGGPAIQQPGAVVVMTVA
jgi:hypothetical protein